MAAKFIDSWLQAEIPDPKATSLSLYREKAKSRKAVLPQICEVVRDHLVGLDIIERMGGYKAAAKIIANRIPTGKQIRSGDLGEILATEIIEQKLAFTVPLRRLRFKDDREMSMRGDDVIALQVKGRVVIILKVEVKSKESLDNTTVDRAHEALMKHAGRPNPATLGCISTMLRNIGRDADATVIEYFQLHEVRDSNLRHLLFTFSANDPTRQLLRQAGSPRPTLGRQVIGLIIDDHQQFIKSVFEAII